MFGYNGRVLRVDMSSGRVADQHLDEAVLRSFLGGRGLAAKILFDGLRPGIDPLGPENRLVLATGPLTGTGIPGCTRYGAFAKSPLTGGWGEAHAAGGFGSTLKAAGYDAVVVEGRSERPRYLWIHEGEAALRDASHLWGRATGETEDAIRGEVGVKGARVVGIGPAGENLVRYACIIGDKNRAAGRCGLGAVMGSKGLKAVAVYGTKGPTFADEKRLREIGAGSARRIAERIREGTDSMHLHGTGGGLASLSARGTLPTKNFREGVFEGAEKITGETMTETVLAGRQTCPGCPRACIRAVEVKTGPYAPVSSEYGGPEYETLAALGSLCMVDDLEALARGGMLCNMYGMDTISTGVAIAFAMECYERGILTKRDTGGLELTWGNAEAELTLIERIARREGLGDLLAEGVRRASERLGGGSDWFAAHVKGMEVPMHDPRGEPNQRLSYVLSNRGACHLQGAHSPTYDAAIRDSLVICSFTQGTLAAPPPESRAGGRPGPGGPGRGRAEAQRRRTQAAAEAVSAATGWKVTAEELVTTGERISTLCRAFNVREGMAKGDDVMPMRLLEPFPSGPMKGRNVGFDELYSGLEEVYLSRDWDPQTGIPTRKKLEALGLGFAADELERLGKLPKETP